MHYRLMYSLLFNAVTDALSFLAQGDTETAAKKLIAAQQKTEELYISAEDGSGKKILKAHF